MKPQPASRLLDLTSPANSLFAEHTIAVPQSGFTRDEYRIRFRDAVSFAICFAIIAVLTGIMLYLKVGVTIAGITRAFFYGGLAGTIGFAVRAVYLYTQRPVVAPTETARLN